MGSVKSLPGLFSNFHAYSLIALATLPTPTFVTVELLSLNSRSLSHSPISFDAQFILVSPFDLIKLTGLATVHSLAFVNLEPSGVAFVQAKSLTLKLLKSFV